LKTRRERRWAIFKKRERETNFTRSVSPVDRQERCREGVNVGLDVERLITWVGFGKKILEELEEP
jgi:hypothetical protein